MFGVFPEKKRRIHGLDGLAVDNEILTVHLANLLFVDRVLLLLRDLNLHRSKSFVVLDALRLALSELENFTSFDWAESSEVGRWAFVSK